MVECAARTHYEASWQTPTWESLDFHTRQIEIEAMQAALEAILKPELKSEPCDRYFEGSNDLIEKILSPNCP